MVARWGFLTERAHYWDRGPGLEGRSRTAGRSGGARWDQGPELEGEGPGLDGGGEIPGADAYSTRTGTRPPTPLPPHPVAGGSTGRPNRALAVHHPSALTCPRWP